MDYQLVEKALLELGRLKYRGRIEFYIYNEPVKDREFLLQCLAEARMLVPNSCLMIATNGDYFKSSSDLMDLYNTGLNQLLINCYSKGLYEKRLAWIEQLPHSISRTKSVYSVLSPKTKTVQILDKSNIEEFGGGIFRLVNRAGNIPEFLPPLAQPVERMCVKPFRLLNINWRGEA
jgi:hypothetical protein